MNKANMDKLIAQLEKMPDKAFDLSRWMEGPLSSGMFGDRLQIEPETAADIVKRQTTTHDCGTVACLAGEAALLAVAENAPEVATASVAYSGREAYVPTLAKAWLGLTDQQGGLLFTPDFDSYSYSEVNDLRAAVTKAQAVAALKRFREAGRVTKAGWRAAGVAVA